MFAPSTDPSSNPARLKPADGSCVFCALMVSAATLVSCRFESGATVADVFATVSVGIFRLTPAREGMRTSPTPNGPNVAEPSDCEPLILTSGIGQGMGMWMFQVAANWSVSVTTTLLSTAGPELKLTPTALATRVAMVMGPIDTSPIEIVWRPACCASSSGTLTNMITLCISVLSTVPGRRGSLATYRISHELPLARKDGYPELTASHRAILAGLRPRANPHDRGAVKSGCCWTSFG